MVVLKYFPIFLPFHIDQRFDVCNHFDKIPLLLHDIEDVFMKIIEKTFQIMKMPL